MDYKIIRANAAIGQIDVAYYNNGQIVGVYAMDVPVVNGAFLTGEALDAEIKHRAPVWAVQRKEEVSSATGFDRIEALVQSLPTEEVDTDAQNEAKLWQKQQFEKAVAVALVKFGVLQSDPTEVEVTHL